MSDRERITYEELRVGDHIQDGDQWQNDDGRWQPFSVAPIQVRQGSRVRRPYKISAILEIGDALDSAQKAATQLQDERDKAQLAIAQVKAEFNNQAEVLAEVRADEERLVSRLELLRSEYTKLQNERDEALAALKSAQRARDELQRQVDELRADHRDEPTARQVQEVLRRWATELDWSAGCFGSFGRSQIDIIQQTMIAVIQRIGSMIDPEATSADA